MAGIETPGRALLSLLEIDGWSMPLVIALDGKVMSSGATWKIIFLPLFFSDSYNLLQVFNL